MSVDAVAEAILKSARSKAISFIVGNFANADMVGHTGNFSATVQAVEAVDRALQRIDTVVQQVGGHLVITADHGNAEQMFDAARGSGIPHIR